MTNEVDMDKKVDVCTGEVPKEGESHGRIDSANGAYKYFKDRFGKLVVDNFNAGVAVGRF